LRSATIPLSAAQAALGLLNGAYLPFFVPSLETRGLPAATIGFMLAISTALRIMVAPAAGLFADARNARRAVMLFFSTLAFLAYAGLAAATAPFAILGLALSATILWAAPQPIVDSSTLLHAERTGVPYGSIRVWASVAFVAGNVVSGFAVEYLGTAIIAPWLAASAGLGVAAIYAMPAPQTTAMGSVVQRVRSTLADAHELMKKPVFLLFLGAAGLIQGSHIFYYSYAGLHWREQGMDPVLIGLVWPLGVFGEIALFAYSAPVGRRIGPVPLMALGAMACALRWTVMAFDPALPVLVGAQLLHGATYAVPHLGAMYFILRATPPRLSATAQNLYAVVAIGLSSSAALFPASMLYGQWGGRTYLLMTAMAAVAALCTLGLALKWNGGRLTETQATDADRDAI
jgi:PPP family 3-phenylpropionic acid transporter